MRALVGLLGLVLGVLVGGALVLSNPLSGFRALPGLPTEAAPPIAYRWDDYRGIEFDGAGLLGVGRRGGELALMDPALAYFRIGIVLIPAGQGAPGAVAVKVSEIAEENSLWRAQLGTHDYWNIFWPGEGSVFATGYSNFWAVNRDDFFAAARGGGRELMATEYPLSAPPPLGESAGVTGASGRYVGFTGEIRELLYPAPPDSTLNSPDWVLVLQANPPPVATR